MRITTILAISVVAVVAILWLRSGNRQPTAASDETSPSNVERSQKVAEEMQQHVAGRRAPNGGGSTDAPAAALGPNGAGRPPHPDMRGGALRPGAPLPPKARLGRQPSTDSAADTADDEPSAAGADAAADEDTDAAEFEKLKNTALNDKDADERSAALGQLAGYDDAEVIPILSRALSDPDADVRRVAVEQLGELDDPPVEIIGQALHDQDPEVRSNAIQTLGGIDGDRAQQLIHGALSDPDEDVRLTAEVYATDESE